MSSCCCSTASSSAQGSRQPLSMPSFTAGAERGRSSGYAVAGMTCGRCVAAVTDAVSAIAGVHDVAVDLASGRLTFTSDAPVARTAVDAAVRRAGYALA